MNHLWTCWTMDWTLLIILLALVVLYGALSVGSYTRIGYFIAALLICAVCFFSPLGILSSHYLFSAHMVVHVLLLLCAGPLFVLSLPRPVKPFSFLFLQIERHPVAGWLTGIGMMWLWHVPGFFNAAMRIDHQNTFHWLSLIENMALLFAGMVFSAPVIHPNKNYRLDPLSAIVYLFTACIGCSLLGLLVTFAPAGTYHHFLSMHDQYNLNPVILLQWGVTQGSDQQLAGLIMWVPGCLIYITGAIYLMVSWYNEKEPNLISKQII